MSSSYRDQRPALPTKRDFKGHPPANVGIGPGFPLGLQARPFFNDEIEGRERIVGWHGIAGVGDARIPDGVGEIDMIERFCDAFMETFIFGWPVMLRRSGIPDLARERVFRAVSRDWMVRTPMGNGPRTKGS